MLVREEIIARLTQIQDKMIELSETRKELAMNLAVSVGFEDNSGINLDNLTMWARQIRKVNTELKILADERRSLRATKRELKPACQCNCH